MSIKKYFGQLPISQLDNLLSPDKRLSLSILLSGIVAANKEVTRILQADNPEVKRSEK